MTLDTLLLSIIVGALLFVALFSLMATLDDARAYRYQRARRQRRRDYYAKAFSHERFRQTL